MKIASYTLPKFKHLKFIHLLNFGFAIGILLLVSCSLFNPADNDDKKQLRTGSVFLENGNYRVDTSFIRNDISKKTLITAFENDQLTDIKSKSEIPSVIQNFLNNISPSRKFTIADKNEDWCQGDITDYQMNTIKVIHPLTQDTIPNNCKSKVKLPTKQLVYCGIGKNTALISYMQGGIVQTQFITMFKFINNKVTDYWYGILNEKFYPRLKLFTV